MGKGCGFMKKKQNEQDMKKTLNMVLGLALLFLSVILAVNGVKKIQDAAVFSAIIAICGVILFGGAFRMQAPFFYCRSE